MKVSEDILNLVPYKPGKPIAETQREYGISEVIKLASNENPLGPSPLALAAIKDSLSQLHLYPDATHYELLQCLSKHLSIPAEQITVGNGSNELIDLLIRIYCEPGESILTTDKAFIAYQICAQAARVKTFFSQLKGDFETDLEAMAAQLRSHPCIKLVFIPNPNNPTGTYISAKPLQKFLEEFAHRKDLLFVFDEAYVEFVRATDYSSALPWVKSDGNIIVLRTFSKAYGLAGLRLGYLVGPQHTVDLVNRVRHPFNLNLAAQVAGQAALLDQDFVKKTVSLTWQGLDVYYEKFQELELPFVKSQGNFILFDTTMDSAHVYENCLRQGVIFRPLKNYGLPRHLRVSVGLPHENERALTALKSALTFLRKGH